MAAEVPTWPTLPGTCPRGAPVLPYITHRSGAASELLKTSTHRLLVNGIYQGAGVTSLKPVLRLWLMAFSKEFYKGSGNF